MLGDVLLRGFERLGELADGGFAVAELVEQADSHRLAEDAEAAGDQLDQVVGQRLGSFMCISFGNKLNSCIVV